MSAPPRSLQRWLLGREASWHRLAAWVESGRERGTRDSAEVICPWAATNLLNACGSLSNSGVA